VRSQWFITPEGSKTYNKANTQINIRKNIIPKRTKKYTKLNYKTPFIISLIHSLFAQKHKIPTELHLEKKNKKKLKIKKTLTL